MRVKAVIAGLAALFLASAAAAQGGGGQQRRAPPEPEPDTPPIRVQGRAMPTLAAIPPAITAENSWILYLSDGGRVVIQLRPDQAPHHVERIKQLTRTGFYNGIIFHRVVEGFMAQGGDPTGTGTGQSELPDLEAEFNALPHLRGTVAMARTQAPNSANSQFYIMFVPRLTMDGQYTVFGRVVSGMDAVDRIQRGQPPVAPTRIVRAAIGADNVPPPTAEEIAAAAAQAPAPALTAPRRGQLQLLDAPTLTPAQPQTPPQQTPPLGASPTPQN